MYSWLPDLVSVDPWSDETYNNLYNIFCREIRDYSLYYKAYPVSIYKDMEDGKEKIFWHLTSRESKIKKTPRRKKKYQNSEKGPRLPDLRRCERLQWIKVFITQARNSELLSFDYEEGDKTIKTYIWFKEEKFVVILKKMKNSSKRILTTSFYVDKQYTYDDFQRKYNNRIK